MPKEVQNERGMCMAGQRDKGTKDMDGGEKEERKADEWRSRGKGDRGTGRGREEDRRKERWTEGWRDGRVKETRGI